MAPNDEVMVGVPQASVAVTVPGAGTPLGLHPKLEPAGQEVITGGVVSLIFTVFMQVDVQGAVPMTKVTI